MDLKEFTNRVAGELRERIGDTCTITETEVLKNNGVRLTGIVIAKEPDHISPTIYLEAAYREYQDGAPIQKVTDEIMKVYEKSTCDIELDMDFFRDYDRVKDRIFYKLINHGKNEELLKDIPHFGWQDLEVVFYYEMDETVFEKAFIQICNSHLAMWGRSAEEVYQTAQQNMKQSRPELLVTLSDLLEEMVGIKMEESMPFLYVLTNKEKVFGASAMLYSEKMKQLADWWMSDLLILPCSIHEVLVLADNRGQGYGFYRQMVNEVNMTQVDPEEILSDNLYRYSREKAEIEQIAV